MMICGAENVHCPTSAKTMNVVIGNGRYQVTVREISHLGDYKKDAKAHCTITVSSRPTSLSSTPHKQRFSASIGKSTATFLLIDDGSISI